MVGVPEPPAAGTNVPTVPPFGPTERPVRTGTIDAVKPSEEAEVERRLEATQTVRALFENTMAVLLDDPGKVLAPEADHEARRARQWPIAMTAQLGGGSAVVQTVLAGLRLREQAPEGAVFDLTWRPTGHTHVLPVFRGALEVMPDRLHTELALRGTYHPPLGPVGAFGDGVVGHRVARRTVETFLASVGGRIDAEVDRRMAEGFRPAPYPPDLRDVPVSENWLG